MGQILTSISGLPISAASAGFSPTNSAEVSAIASGYQVVSSTATQLYAGTAYLTSVNDAPVSASRAGQAANASMANSAFYDGTGRLISSLPDEAAVSSIASSYAESAASGKQDASAMTAYQLSGDYAYNSALTAYQLSGDYAYNSSLTGYIPTSESSKYVTSLAGYATEEYVDSAVSGKLDTTAFNSGDFYTTANESGYVGSSYVDSAVSGKAESSALSSYVPYSSLEYNTASAISGINGSAIAGGGGTTYTAGNMISLANGAIAVSTTVGITDIQKVSALPENPIPTVLYLIPET